MGDTKYCRYCAAVGTGQSVPVTRWPHVLDEWHLCHRCFGYLKTGFLAKHDVATFDAYLDGRGLRLTTADVHTLVLAGLAIVHGLGRRA